MNDSIILFLGVLILALLIALLTRQELESQRLAALVANLRDEVRYDIPPARRVTIEGSILAVLRSDGKKKTPRRASPSSSRRRPRSQSRTTSRTHRARGVDSSRW